MFTSIFGSDKKFGYIRIQNHTTDNLGFVVEGILAPLNSVRLVCSLSLPLSIITRTGTGTGTYSVTYR
jgi:hypothetical protein